MNRMSLIWCGETSNRNLVVDMERFHGLADATFMLISLNGSLSIAAPRDAVCLLGSQPASPARMRCAGFVFRLPCTHTGCGAKCILGMEVCRWAGKSLAAPIAGLRNAIASLWVLSSHLGNSVAFSRTVYSRPALRRNWGIANLALLCWANATPTILQITQARTKFRRRTSIERTKHAMTLFAMFLRRLSTVSGTHIEQYTELQVGCQTINIDYCKIAEQRLAQEVLAL